MSKIRFGFVTSVRLGLSCMKAIYDSGNKLSLVVTLPDNISTKKVGRVFLDDFCSHHYIPLIKSHHINNKEIINLIKKNKIDWLFIIGWSQIASPKILQSVKYGVIGAHPTLLPIGRGRSPIPWTILKKLNHTGVTFFKIDQGVDTGPILIQDSINIDDAETATSLYDKIEKLHFLLTKKLISLLILNNINLIEQNESFATVWPSRRPEDGEINIFESVWEAERLIRAVTKPYPGAFYFESNKKIIIWKARVSKEKSLNKKFLQFKDGFLILEDYDIIC